MESGSVIVCDLHPISEVVVTSNGESDRAITNDKRGCDSTGSDEKREEETRGHPSRLCKSLKGLGLSVAALILLYAHKSRA